MMTSNEDINSWPFASSKYALYAAENKKGKLTTTNDIPVNMFRGSSIAIELNLALKKLNP